MENEKKVHDLVAEQIEQWQVEGLVPSGKIESGDKTEEVRRNRGWAYWHQLFNARQLFVLSRFAKQIQNAPTQLEKAAGILGLNKCADFGCFR